SRSRRARPMAGSAYCYIALPSSASRLTRSELEIDELFGAWLSDDREVRDHEGCQAHSHRLHVNPFCQRRLTGVEELVHPYSKDQDRHHHREARVCPAGREDPANYLPRVGQALRPEEYPGEGDEYEYRQLLDQTGNPFLVKLRMLQLAGQT